MGLRIDGSRPLFFWPSRLYPQKGPELLAAVAERCIDVLGAQIAVVANGEPDTVRRFVRLARTSRGQIAYRPFDAALSEQGKAGADFVLMPSRYEPCGLPQMECPRFGTLPVARSTGGLRDTVAQLRVEAGSGNGFVFDAYSATALFDAMRKGAGFFELAAEQRWQNIRRIMRESREEFSLEKTADGYIELYQRLINGGPA